MLRVSHVGKASHWGRRGEMSDFKDRYIGELEHLSQHLLNRLRDEFWHHHPGRESDVYAWEFLGLSEIEYKKWLNDPEFYIPRMPEDTVIQNVVTGE